MINNFKQMFNELCEDKGVNIRQVSAETNIKENSLYRLCERNIYPSYEIAIKLCNYFNCSIDYFLGLSDKFEKDGIYTTNEFINNYINLLSAKKISIYRMKKDTGIGLGRIYDWKKGNLPSVATLITIAKYFDITVDELITKN